MRPSVLRPLQTLVALAMTAAHAACGGNVVVDRATTTATTASTATATSTSTTTTTGTTTVDLAGLCTDACTAAANAGCGVEFVPDCVLDCKAAVAQARGCFSEAQAVAECVARRAGQCLSGPPAECEAAVAAFEACAGGAAFGCDEPTCDDAPEPSGPTGSCACSRTCSGTPVEARCTTTNGFTECACLAGGEAIATCSLGVSADACNLRRTCCASSFGLLP